MGLRLFLYLGLLLLGGIIGNKGKVSKRIDANLGRIQNFFLLFLLFAMGITIGINEEIVSNLLSIGLKAGAMAISTVVFSLIFVYVINKIFKLEVNNNES